MSRLNMLLVLVLTLLSASCVSSSAPADGQPLKGAELPALPAPAELLELPRETSALLLQRNGADFEAGLPNSGVSIDGAAAVFAAAAETGLNELGYSYAIYSFNLEGAVEDKLRALMQASPELLWFGIADFAAERWDWEQMGPAQSYISLDGRVAADGSVFVALVSIAATDLRLSGLSFSSYDETENNDTFDTANLLPGLNFAGFRGNAGMLGGEPGNDGDGEDWFELQGSFVSNQLLIATVKQDLSQFGQPLGEVDLQVCTAAGVVIDDGFGFNGSVSISLKFDDDFTAADLPLKLRVFCDPGDSGAGGNYNISVRSGFKPVAEFVISNRFPEVDELTTLDASNSSDPDNNISLYLWSYDEATFANPLQTSQNSIQVAFTTEGSRPIELTVVDANGFSSTDEDVLFVGTNPFDEIEPNDFDQRQALDPLKSAGWKGNVGSEGTQIYDGGDDDCFSLPLADGLTVRMLIETTSGSGAHIDRLFYSPPLNNALPLLWAPGLQLTNISGAEALALVDIGLGLNGDDGGDYTLSWIVGIPPQNTEINADVTSGPGPLEVNFTASSTDPDGEIVLYEWDFDEDRVVDATGPSAMHTFTQFGTNRVDLIVTDNDGLIAGRSVFIQVQ